MTLDELLLRMDSRELSERLVANNIDWWKKRLADKNADMSKRILATLFGKALAKGAVKWQEKMN